MTSIWIYLAITVPMFACIDVKITDIESSRELSRGTGYSDEEFHWIENELLGLIDTTAPISNGRTEREIFEGRRKKKKKMKMNKYLIPLAVGFLLIKSVLLPLTLKALAILSGKAVMLSLMSLILAAIVGLKAIAYGSPLQSKVDLVNLPLSKYKRKDLFDQEEQEEDPYKFYADQRTRRRK